jgi:hypothetical protein
MAEGERGAGLVFDRLRLGAMLKRETAEVGRVGEVPFRKRCERLGARSRDGLDEVACDGPSWTGGDLPCRRKDRVRAMSRNSTDEVGGRLMRSFVGSVVKGTIPCRR